MGKYSLDAFEQYPLTKLRPVVAEPFCGCYRLLDLSWSELEANTGDRVVPPEIGEGAVVLRINLDARRDVAEACGFIRRIGSCCEGGKGLTGVVLTAGEFTGTEAGEIVKAYRQGFESTWLLAEPETELMELCRRAEILTGLWLPLSRGVLSLRRSIARSHLERTWRSRPVYLYAGRELQPEELDAARRWHCSGADCVSELGAHMTLRRVMFPRDLTVGGVMPLRMWWQNLGSAPLYRETRVQLMLGNGEQRYALSVPGEMMPGMGDTTFNTTLHLPKLPCGTYSLWVGLKSGGAFLPLEVDAPTENGMYHIGDITLDDVDRPYLSTMWEEQYADGYYPLEDPVQPE